jgi:hypothetical protein
LEIRDGGQAFLLVTFPLHSPLPLPLPSPHPSAPLAPSTTPAPLPTHPIPPLFPEGTAPPGYAKAASGRLQVLAYTLLPPPMPLPSNRLRRSFRKATLMRAAKAASSLSPPLPGTLRAAATISCSKLLELAAAGKPASPTPAPTPAPPSTPPPGPRASKRQRCDSTPPCFAPLPQYDGMEELSPDAALQSGGGMADDPPSPGPPTLALGLLRPAPSGAAPAPPELLPSPPPSLPPPPPPPPPPSPPPPPPMLVELPPPGAQLCTLEACGARCRHIRDIAWAHRWRWWPLEYQDTCCVCGNLDSDWLLFTEWRISEAKKTAWCKGCASARAARLRRK